MLASSSAQILGCEALITRDVRHTHSLLIKHILALRNLPEIAHTTCVFIFESNLAFESQHLLHAIEAAGIRKWVSLSEGQASTHGWLTVRFALLVLPPPRTHTLRRERPSVSRELVWAQTNERKVRCQPVAVSKRGGLAA